MSWLADTHCHLNCSMFDQDLICILGRAWEQGLSRILVQGINLENSREAVRISEMHPNIFAAVGVHPNDAQTWQSSTKQELRVLAQHPKVVAIGEIGLDYYRQHAPHDLQMEIFKTQLELAAEIQKPVVLHCRQSFCALWPVLKGWHETLSVNTSVLAQYPGVLHSYEGDVESALEAIDRNFFIGINGVITFKKTTERQKVVADLPMEALLLETDAPFLAPHPHRGERNEPAYVSYVAKKVAELHQKPLSMVSDMTSKNAENLFAW